MDSIIHCSNNQGLEFKDTFCKRQIFYLILLFVSGVHGFVVKCICSHHLFFLLCFSFLNIIIINCGSALMHFVDAVVYVVVAILLYSFLQRIPKRMAKQWSECSSLDS